ncbi:MAG TPA: c(7)-type cytochrome triheme domain-containing protein [Anaeromyxobacteraceae bacterium]|nr:c(7)-type cytochrome triheme domain-containing protein [Anaeromyxobacteraceae bacterium]
MTARALRLLAAAALLAGGAALADLPRLPKDLLLARSAESPGQVTFRHESHVDAAKPACLPCHAERFSLLGKNAEPARRTAVTHAAMEKGQACGACHGKAAFGFEDCSMCHAQ